MRDTSLIEIKFASRNPEEAANIANRIAATSGNLPQVHIVDLATTPTQQVFVYLANGLKLVALGVVLLVVGFFVLLDTRPTAARAA